jgi:hypothetical protein
MMKILILLMMLASPLVWAQNSSDTVDSFEEFETPMQPTPPPSPPSKRKGSLVDQEMKLQNQILKRKREGEAPIDANREIDRFPVEEPIFRKPPGPKAGGSVRVEHPRAAEGLIRINKDGSYQYRTVLKEKSQSGSFRLGAMTPPKITSANSGITFESMYGSTDLFMLNFDYEWQPFRGFGSLGLVVGSGFATMSAKGTFKSQVSGRPARSEESYSLFIVPVSAFLNYRFEFVRRQWVVPFITGGGTYYGMVEVRDDGKPPSLAGAPAAGGGGGLLISISRMDAASAFTLSQEYGVADMWLVLEARAMQGLSKDTDFTSQMISAGISVDF